MHVVKARRERLAALISQNGYLPVKELCRQLEVSEATARRDLSVLEGEKRIKRTYGGAISEFDSRFPSFAERRSDAQAAKEKIAMAALSFIQPGTTLFLDTGTTVYAIAEAFRNQPIVPIRVVTSSIPVGEVLARIAGVEVFLLSGQLFPRQSVLLGEMAIRSLGFWRFDLAFLSAEGMDAAGIWNSQAAIVEQQKAALRRCNRSVFCLDATKLKRSVPHFLMPWNEVDLLLTDATPRKLEEAGIQLRPTQYYSATMRGHRESPVENAPVELGSGELPFHML